MMQRVKTTLLFTGVWFWAGIGLLVMAAFVRMNPLQPSPPELPFVSPFESLYPYLAPGLLLLGIVYTVVGWNKARRMGE